MANSLKRLLSFVGLLCAVVASGQDITQGHVFANSETVTAASMNAIVGSATINAGFYTAKAVETAAQDADVFLLYSPSLAGFRQIIVANVLYTNATLITRLFSDTDVNRRSNFLAGADSTAISNFLAGATPQTRSNFYNGFWTNSLPFTNAPLYTNGLSALETNASDMLLVWNSTSNTVNSITLANVRPTFTSGLFPSYNVGAASVKLASTVHGFPGTPSLARWVLVVTNANNAEAIVSGHYYGDEIPISDVWSFYSNTNNGPAYSGGANSTNVFLYCVTNTTGYKLLAQNNVAGGGGWLTNFVATNWAAKCYSSYFP